MALDNQSPTDQSKNTAGGQSLLVKAQNVALEKTKRSPKATFALSILAGLMIASGATFMLLVKSDGTLSWGPAQLLGGVCFSLGLICVIVAGAELFTGNSLMVDAALGKQISWSALLKNWGIVYLGNIVGSLILVGVLCGAHFALLNDGGVGQAAMAVASSKTSLSCDVIFFRGILCNWLVCLAVWMSFAGRSVSDKVLTTIFPVAAFVACGFEHCVANMFFLPFGYAVQMISGSAAGSITLAGIGINIVFATLGNIVGGAIFVGLSYFIAYNKKNRKNA